MFVSIKCAQSYAGLGKKAMQHRALAEVFALQGQTQGAVEQLELAQKAGDANFSKCLRSMGVCAK
jgi:predicted Zn-dependent protease